MEDFKGTKGKWAIENVSNPNGSFYKVKVDNSESICNITTRDTERSRLNAQLIAVAPELLDALSEAANFIREIDINVNHEEGFANAMMNAIIRLEYFDMVIAKALGKEADSE